MLPPVIHLAQLSPPLLVAWVPSPWQCPSLLSPLSSLLSPLLTFDDGPAMCAQVQTGSRSQGDSGRSYIVTLSTYGVYTASTGYLQNISYLHCAKQEKHIWDFEDICSWFLQKYISTKRSMENVPVSILLTFLLPCAEISIRVRQISRLGITQQLL